MKLAYVLYREKSLICFVVVTTWAEVWSLGLPTTHLCGPAAGRREAVDHAHPAARITHCYCCTVAQKVGWERILYDLDIDTCPVWSTFRWNLGNVEHNWSQIKNQRLMEIRSSNEQNKRKSSHVGCKDEAHSLKALAKTTDHSTRNVTSNTPYNLKNFSSFPFRSPAMNVLYMQTIDETNR
jgi:hypothetical protein